MCDGDRKEKIIIYKKSWPFMGLFRMIFFPYLISWLHGTFKDLSHKTRASLVAQTVRNPPAIQDFNPWVRKILWRRKWIPIPVFLPGEFHRQRRLAGYSPWGCKELDTIKQLTFLLHFPMLWIFIAHMILFLIQIYYPGFPILFSATW